MAPSDEIELQNMVETSYSINNRPSIVRFPRGSGYGYDILNDIYSEVSNKQEVLSSYINGDLSLTTRGKVLSIGKGRIIKQASLGKKYRVAILSIGTRLVAAMKAAREVEKLHGDTSVTVADARFMKPLDEDLIRSLAQQHEVLITVEEGSKGGFGAHVLHFLVDSGLMDNTNLKVRTMYIPDIWIEAGTQKEQYDIAGLNEKDIIDKVSSVVQSIRDYKPRGIIDARLFEPFPNDVEIVSSSSTTTTTKWQ